MHAYVRVMLDLELRRSEEVVRRELGLDLLRVIEANWENLLGVGRCMAALHDGRRCEQAAVLLPDRRQHEPFCVRHGRD